MGSPTSLCTACRWELYGLRPLLVDVVALAPAVGVLLREVLRRARRR